MNVNLKSLIGKLNDPCRNALEAAAGLCVSRTHYDVEIEHLLLKLSEVQDGDVGRILRQYEIEPARLIRDLTRALDGFKTGNARTPALSPRIPEILSAAWLLCSIDYGRRRIRSGHLLLAMLSDERIGRQVRDACTELRRIAPDDLRRRLPELASGSAEERADAAGADDAEPSEGSTGAARTGALDQYTVDLTARARTGGIDPVLGRDSEIRLMVDILTRRRQNNPILTGEAGVGKTAVVEGLALRIAAGDVPPPLQNVALRVLDLGLLQAGAGVKGEFENRLKSVIEEVKGSPQPIIVFIDEAHTLIGAGGTAGQGDAANLLKPALARGELRTIAATTWAEYKKYFEKDAALARRFQVVKVDEPDEARALVMMRGLVKALEGHHKVRILDDAVDGAVRLSHRYLTGRQLPDKAVSVLDTAGARVALMQVATPPAIEDCHRRLDAIATERRILERESATGANHAERLAGLGEDEAQVRGRLAELEKRWQEERDLIARARELRQALEGLVDGGGQTTSDAAAGVGSEGAPPKLDASEVERLRAELADVNAKLAALQGDSPLVQACVDAQTVAEVISGWTGIPVGKMVKDEILTVLSLQDVMGKRIVGQSHALEAISQRIRTSRAKLEDPRRPIGVFLLVGPSGVGKTETALTLADTLFGGERNIVTINMSEYQEAHTVSGLKGSPPGYVGYGEGGVLTEAVRRKPYSVVLLDEMEKAHQDVMELFYQVFDKGVLEDSEGREIDFKNTIILMTSNAASDVVMKLCADPETRPEPEALADALRPDLLKVFKPAFLGRMIVVPFYPINDEMLRQIIQLQLGKIRSRLHDNSRTAFSFDASLVDAIAQRCTEVDSGARNVDHILTRTLLPAISQEFLARMAAGESVSKVHIGVDQASGFTYHVS